MVHDFVPILILPADKLSPLLTKLLKLKIRYVRRESSLGTANIGHLTMLTSQWNDGFTLKC